MSVKRGLWFASLGAFLLATLVQGIASAEPKRFGPFAADPARPSVITLDGILDAGAALAFRRALAAQPNAHLLVLNSDGGLVQMGLLIADDVFQRKMATLIPVGSHCFSACSFIFLAGQERRAEGQLGVHQISSDLPDLESAQLSISDIIEQLNRFETPIDVLTIMFRTRPDEMYVFSAEEIDKFRINRQASSETGPPESSPKPSFPLLGLETVPPDLREKPALAAPEATAPNPPPPAIRPEAAARLSEIEQYTKRPTRIALFAGLDFAGQDIGSEAVPDAGACARRCLEMSPSCKAFTFNVQTRSDEVRTAF